MLLLVPRVCCDIDVRVFEVIGLEFKVLVGYGVETWGFPLWWLGGSGRGRELWD